MSYEQIARLTDRQIAEIENHKRDKKTGEIKFPVDEIPDAELQPATLEEELAAVDTLAQIFSGVHPDQKRIDVDELKAKLREKYSGRSVGGNHGVDEQGE